MWSAITEAATVALRTQGLTPGTVSSRRTATHAYSSGKIRLQNSVVCPTDLVPSGEGFLDDLQLVVHSELQLENYAAIADGF